MRIIDADTLFDEIKCLKIFLSGESLFTPAIKGTVLRTIDEQPTISNALELVRCADCKDYEIFVKNECACLGCLMPSNGFCSYGERKIETLKNGEYYFKKDGEKK